MNHVPWWTFARLRPLNTFIVWSTMHDDNHEIEFGIGGKQMANDLVIGNNVIVVCESSTNEHF
jgi:hypothetical protein